MEKISIEGTPKTPGIEFDATTGVLQIKGRSIPENSLEFYKPIIDWIEDYANNPIDNTNVNIQLEYFNTSSSKCILDIFQRLEKINKSGGKVTVNWHFETDDEDMHEAGEDYQAILDLPFKMIEVKGA